jgi:hypothetical protein
MAKARKQKRNKKYNYNVNRKKKWLSMKKKRVIDCKEMRDEMVHGGGSLKSQMENMGLVYDVNKAFKLPSLRKQLVEKLKEGKTKGRRKKGKKSEEQSTTETTETKREPTKAHVAKAIEADATAPRVHAKFKQPIGLVKMATYFFGKYGEDYERMARDPKNYWQYTPGQLRRKLKVLRIMPKEYAEELRAKGIDVPDIQIEKPSSMEVDTT